MLQQSFNFENIVEEMGPERGRWESWLVAEQSRSCGLAEDWCFLLVATDNAQDLWSGFQGGEQLRPYR